MFIPNWKKNGLKSKEEGLKHVLAFLKKEQKRLADRGYGETKIMNGIMETLVILKGSNIKRKKEFVYELR